MNRLEIISKLLLEEISDRFEKEPLSIEGLEFSESFAEILDRFIVQHIRMWKIEDAIGASNDNNEIADLKRKVDYLFKDRRPKLIKAINSFLDVYIDKNHARKFTEENVKLYKGYKN
jgi:hypothetical protein